TVDALIPGDAKPASGQVSMIENAVDATTASSSRSVNSVQVSQTGNFVFVVDANNVAHVRRVTTERQVNNETVITTGLAGGETVVTDGQLLLSEGKHVSPRPPRPAAAPAASGS